MFRIFERKNCLFLKHYTLLVLCFLNKVSKLSKGKRQQSGDVMLFPPPGVVTSLSEPSVPLIYKILT